jgi:hypothetical protein
MICPQCHQYVPNSTAHVGKLFKDGKHTVYRQVIDCPQCGCVTIEEEVSDK